MKFFTLSIILLLSLFASFTYAQQSKSTSSPYKPKLVAGDSYDLFINNIELPIGRDGIIADVLIPPATLAGGKFQNKIVLYSGGFYMSGLTNGTLWANGMMTASRITDYVPGTYATGQNDPKAQIYVIKSTDPDFDIGVIDPTQMSWTQWKDAVSLGADFYDGDHDGVYNPADKNSNNKWDPDEDRPDILGDITAWCVYSDQLPSALRTFPDVAPQGVEIRQTIFAFNTKDPVKGNIFFIRYKIVNTGIVADTLNSVYFSPTADADIGDNGAQDLVGCDTSLNIAFTYHLLNSTKWGSTPPCFIVDFLQGPRSYIPGVTFTDNNGNGVFDVGIDTPIDTATDVRGRILGVRKYPGAKNLGLSSFFNYGGGSDPGSRFQLRYYTLGLNNVGSLIDPCTYGRGTVLGGVNCVNVDPLFMFSGDPITNVGWLCNAAEDQRQISNTGPFKLIKNDTVSIVIAYIVGQGNSGLNSLTVAKNNDAVAQNLFDSNFSPATGINDNRITKIDYNLYQNYPNPFNPSTVIKYSLSHPGNVKLIVYNSLGQTVKILVNSPQSAGIHEVNFDASTFASGVYFYTLFTGSASGDQSFHSTRKMLLIK